MKKHIFLLSFCVSVLTGCKYAEILSDCNSCRDSCAAHVACPCKKSELIGEWGGRFEPQKVLLPMRLKPRWSSPYSKECELAIMKFTDDNKFIAYYRKKEYGVTMQIESPLNESPLNFIREELVYRVECDMITFDRQNFDFGSAFGMHNSEMKVKFSISDDTITFVVSRHNLANETIVLHRMPNGSIEKLKAEFESSIRAYEQYIKERLDQGD